ncbi:MAG: MFS transporter [Chloroflexota bacterium]
MLRLSGMRAFTIVWFGQVVSMLGSAMTRFAFIIWVWGQTGEATTLALITLFGAIPSVLVSLFAGSVVDRGNRKWIMILADLGTAIPTLILLILLLNGSLQVWHLYVTAAIGGLFGPFQGLAFQASVTTMVPKAQYTRANGMMSLSQYISQVGAPVFAGLLLSVAGIQAVLVFDLMTFLVAVISAGLIAFPQIIRVEEKLRKSFLSDSAFGFRYIFTRPALRRLFVLILGFGLFESLGFPLIAPMILARTGNNEVILGTVLGVMGISGLLGGVLVTLWGGTKRRVHALLIGTALTGLLGDSLMGLGSSLPVWLFAAVFIECFIPLAMGSNQALWQSKTPPETQGRVFAARGLVDKLTEALPIIFAGVLADRVFEPAMQPGGALVPIFGGLVGTAAGAGMALLLIACGVFCGLVSVWGYLANSVRQINALPDHEVQAAG